MMASYIALPPELHCCFSKKPRRRTYGPAGIPVYWIVNLNGLRVEVYTDPGPEGYRLRTDYVSGMNVPLVIDGVVVGEIRVDDILPR